MYTHIHVHIHALTRTCTCTSSRVAAQALSQANALLQEELSRSQCEHGRLQARVEERQWACEVKLQEQELAAASLKEKADKGQQVGRGGGDSGHMCICVSGCVSGCVSLCVEVHLPLGVCVCFVVWCMQGYAGRMSSEVRWVSSLSSVILNFASGSCSVVFTRK